MFAVYSAHAVTFFHKMACFAITMWQTRWRAVVAGCDNPVIFDEHGAGAKAVAGAPRRDNPCDRHKVVVPRGTFGICHIVSRVAEGAVGWQCGILVKVIIYLFL